MSRDTVISISGINREGWKDGMEPDLGGASQRPLFQRVSYSPRISLNALLISLLCTLLLVFMGFVIVSLPSPLELDRLRLGEPVHMIQYTFQIPLALMIGAFLGPYLGTFSVLLFLACGLFVHPVFAGGGGLHYIAEPGFGYLLATLAMSHVVGKRLHKVFQKQNQASRSLKLLAIAGGSVLSIHLLGALYMAGLALTGQLPWLDLPGWLLRLTLETAPYDLLATTVFLCLVRQLRLGLWLVLY